MPVRPIRWVLTYDLSGPASLHSGRVGAAVLFQERWMMDSETISFAVIGFDTFQTDGGSPLPPDRWLELDIHPGVRCHARRRGWRVMPFGYLIRLAYAVQVGQTLDAGTVWGVTPS